MPLVSARANDPPAGARKPKRSTRDPPPPGCCRAAGTPSWRDAKRRSVRGVVFRAICAEHDRGAVAHEGRDGTQLKSVAPSMPVGAKPGDNLLAGTNRTRFSRPCANPVAMRRRRLTGFTTQHGKRCAQHQCRIAGHARLVLPIADHVLRNQPYAVRPREPEVDRVVRRRTKVRRKPSDPSSARLLNIAAPGVQTKFLDSHSS